MTDRITVAVATCGHSDGLARCLEALASGTRVPNEVIVVDQSPSPGSQATVEACPLPIRHLLQDRRGLSASRNLALDAATSAVLAVTDDDCVPDSRWVETIVGAMSMHSDSLVTGAILPLGKQPPGTYAVSLRDGTEPVLHDRRVPPWFVGSGANMAGPVAVLRRLGGWDERLGTGSPGQAGEDVALIDAALRASVSVRYEPAAVVRHEWTDRRRRLSTRWSYGFGLGVFLAFRGTAGDPFVIRMTSAYLRPHVRAIVAGAIGFDRDRIAQHGRAVVGMAVGVIHGVRIRRHPTRRGAVSD